MPPIQMVLNREHEVPWLTWTPFSSSHGSAIAGGARGVGLGSMEASRGLKWKKDPTGGQEEVSTGQVVLET